MKDWEKKFDEKFIKYGCQNVSWSYYIDSTPKKLKSFIRTLLEEERSGTGEGIHMENEGSGDCLHIDKSIKAQCADELEEAYNQAGYPEDIPIVDNLIKKWRGK